MKKISATIITYNEEKNIERCLKSLQGIADEIIVVDSYSADKTKEICLKYKVCFFDRAFKDYYSFRDKITYECDGSYSYSLSYRLSEQRQSCYL